MVVTMRDVAKEAGVSPASVSFALRGDPRIKQETAQHIIEVANRMNYSVNATAKSLRSGRTGVIEAVYQVDRPFYAQLLAGISSAALRAGVQAVVQQISYGKAGNEKNIRKRWRTSLRWCYSERQRFEDAEIMG
ncbi:MAG: LacI family DNA-binding transcriptional regulator [Bifidobacterium breve]